MRTRAHDLSLDVANRRRARKYRPGRDLRVLPNRVHLRRGYRMRGHVPR